MVTGSRPIKLVIVQYRRARAHPVTLVVEKGYVG